MFRLHAELHKSLWRAILVIMMVWRTTTLVRALVCMVKEPDPSEVICKSTVHLLVKLKVSVNVWGEL